MKRIILKQEESVSLEEISNTSIIGIEWESGSKCMIINTPEGFCSISNENRPNILGVWYAKSTKEYVERALNQGNNTNSKAFVFETPSQLFKWMSN
jgi:hypothetical protein